MNKRFLSATLFLLAIQPAFAQEVFSYLADFKDVAYYGFADSAGHTKTVGKYNLIMRPSEGICRVWAGQKSSTDYTNIRYGFCLPNGTEIIPPQFVKAEDFSAGRAVVATGNLTSGYRYGYVNTKGNTVITPQYKSAKNFSQGLAPVAKGDKDWHYIDSAGLVKIAGPFLDADVFSEGLAGVSIPYDMGSGIMSFRKGYIDLSGKIVIQPAYNYVMPFKNGRAVVSISESTPAGTKSYQALIDKAGKRLTSQAFISISHLPGDGLYAVKISGSTGLASDGDVWGVIDANGVLQGARFPSQPFFSEGLAVFAQEGKYGLMDKTGQVIVKPTYKSLYSFTEGLAAAQFENGLWGYINKKGAVVIQPIYLVANRFSDGLAVVSTGKNTYDRDRLTGAIDKTGKWVIPLQKQGLGEFKNGKAIAEKEYITYYVYKDGKTSLACDASTLANGRFAVQALAKSDVQGAVTMLQKEQGKGCAMIDYWLGFIQLQAQPPLRDTIQGAKLIEQAAAKAYPEAMYSLGFVYLHGLGGKKDEGVAKQWLTKAAKAGIPSAYTLLGTTVEKTNPAQAAEYYLQAAGFGEPVSMYNLALLYRDGRGVTKNNYQYHHWLQQAAQRNYTPAKQLLETKGK